MRVLIVLFIFWHTPIAAQSVSIRSGEHETFSRLVLTLPQEAEWSLVGQDQTYLFSVDDVSDFQTQEVFSRIPRKRIGDVTSSTEGLAIDLVCDCHATSFEFGENQVVIDINDGPSPTESVPSASTPEPEKVAINLPIILNEPRRIEQMSLPLRLDKPSDQGIQEMQRTILETFSRASAEGLIGIRELTQAGEDLPTREIQSTSTMAGPTQFRSLTAFDPMDFDQSGTQDLGEDMPSCGEADLFAVHEWSDGRPFGTQIGFGRSTLFSAVDSLKTEAVISLAKTYLYYGFGAEALVHLGPLEATNETAVLTTIAETMEFGGPFSQDSCIPQSAIWRLLVNSTSAEVQDINEIQLAFLNWPSHLQRQLGPTLAQRLVEQDESDAAKKLLVLSSRNVDVTPVEVLQTQSGLEAALDDTEQAMTTLRKLVFENPRVEIESVVSLIELEIEVNGTVEKELLELAEAMLFDAPSANDRRLLSDVLIDAFLSRNEPIAAFAFASRELPDDSETLNAIVTAAIEIENDGSFVRTVYAVPHAQLDPGIQNRVAERLAGLGFLDYSEAFVSAETTGDAARERRFARANIRAKRNDFAEASELLAGMTDERSRTILSDILSVPLSDTDNVLETARLAGLEFGPELSWRTQQWTALSAQSSDPLLASLGEQLTEVEILEELQAVTLEDRRAAIEKSESTRDLIEKMFDRFESP